MEHKEGRKVMEEFVRKTNEALEGKTIVSAKVDGFGIELTLDDGNKFLYSAADGGYSSWDFFDRNE